MAASRAADFSSNLAGKSATTRTRYGSATSSATALYSSIVAYSFRRYFWVTVSMWVDRSASRSSIWRASVQTCWLTSAPSKSARCMNAPKLRPIPMGSTIVNRTWPGGKLVKSRNIEAWSTARAAARPSAGVSIKRLALAGNVLKAGKTNDAGTPSIKRASAGIPCGSAASSSGTVPKRTTGGTTRGKGRSAQGRVVPGRAVAVDLTVDRVELGGRGLHPFAPAVGHLAPGDLVLVANCSLSDLYFSSSLGTLVSTWRRSSASTAIVLIDARSHVALLGRLDFDHPLGVDLVDLAQLLVALGLGGGKCLAIVFLDALQLVVAASGDFLAFLLEGGIDQAATVCGQRIGVGQRVHERQIAAFELRSARA